VVADDQGRVVQSLSYNDYGFTRIEGQSAAASFDSMASFYRFQGQEQEVFPLARLGIEDDGLAQWLDQIQLYHFPWRDYGAGLAAFTQTDPVPTEDSLYSAFAANPVNSTDETGGMLGALVEIGPLTHWETQYRLRYAPAHRIIAPRLQTLLDRLEINRNLTLASQETLDLRTLQLAIYSQSNNPNNPFLPDEWISGEWDEHSNSYLMRLLPISQERAGEAERAFVDLRREQNDWLRRYSALISDRWYRERSRLVSLRHPMEAQDEEDEEKKIELEQPTTQNQGTDEDVNDAPLNSAAADGNDGSPPDQQEFEGKEELDQKLEPAQASEPSERHMPRSEDVEENRSGKCCCCIL
jgi:RHS repeat-associated protein